jgi:hypothetical protein
MSTSNTASADHGFQSGWQVFKFATLGKLKRLPQSHLYQIVAPLIALPLPTATQTWEGVPT